MSTSLRKEAISAYQKISEQWLKFHYHGLLLCVVISIILEIIMYFIIHFTGTIYDSNLVYWLKYVIAPALCGITISICAFFTLRSRRLKTTVKFYSISILMMMFATNLAFFHSGYQVVFFAFLIPILITVMYENQHLTATIVLLSIPLEVLTTLTTVWDDKKDMSHAYILNLFILIIMTLVTWMVCYYIIRFALMKKELVIDREIERKQLKEKILMDELTMIGNKNAMFKHLKQVVNDGTCYYLVMIDIDDFKIINDLYGHLFGDEVLRCLGTALNRMRSQCLPFRYGGDEFSLIILDDDKNKVLKDITMLQEAFESLLLETKRKTVNPITISVGISYSYEHLEPIQIIKYADDALYKSKNKSKNTITFYELKNDRLI